MRKVVGGLLVINKMRRVYYLIITQALLSVAAGVLVSQMSFLGKMSIGLFYRDFALLRVWWQSALLFLAMQLVLIGILLLSRKIMGLGVTSGFAALLLAACVVGVYFTYLDFTETSRKMMQVYFHSGIYLFWISWGVTCLYFMFFRKKKDISEDTEMPKI